MRQFYTFLMVSFMALTVLYQSASAQNNVMLIIDASGSMKEKVDGKTRISVAKEVVGDALGKLPADTNLGLMVYGHRRAKDCTDIELVSPIGAEKAAMLSEMVSKLDAKGETPIAEALNEAAKSFKVFKGQQNQIILVTDGLEECKGDPCAAAKSLKDAGLDVAVNIVGFTLNDDKAKQLQCVTDLTGGKYYSATNAAALTEAMQAVQKQVEETVIVQEAKPTMGDNLLAEKNGGRLEYAPNDHWATLSKDPKSLTGPTYQGEAVWSFKDGKAAKFDQIEVFIPKEYRYNLKDFEVLAADDLSGPYRSLGEFAAQNVRMMPEGWQGFKFQETTAHFLKVVFKTGQNGYVIGNSLRLKGAIEESSESIKHPEPAKGIDILSQTNGGTLVSAPNDAWAGINGKPKNFKGPTYQGAGIWSFKDGKAATFEQLKIYVAESYKYNLKDFEILAGDDMAGPYQSLGEFTVRNYKEMPDGWQSFNVPKTTAKYVKIIFNTGQDGYVMGHPIQLIGTIDEASNATVLPQNRRRRSYSR